MRLQTFVCSRTLEDDNFRFGNLTRVDGNMLLSKGGLSLGLRQNSPHKLHSPANVWNNDVIARLSDWVKLIIPFRRFLFDSSRLNKILPDEGNPNG